MKRAHVFIYFLCAVDSVLFMGIGLDTPGPVGWLFVALGAMFGFAILPIIRKEQ